MPSSSCPKVWPLQLWNEAALPAQPGGGGGAGAGGGAGGGGGGLGWSWEAQKASGLLMSYLCCARSCWLASGDRA